MKKAKLSATADLSPIALTNLSPDSFFGLYLDPQNLNKELGPNSKRYYVYKANDTLIVGGLNGMATMGAYINAIPTGNNVSIQATNLIIATSIISPQADIQIYCKHLTIPTGVTVTIDVSAQGNDGSDTMMVHAAVTPADEGQPGQNGTTVAHAWAQDIADAKAQTPPKDPSDSAYGPPIDYQFGQDGEAGGSITIICDELQLDGTLTLIAKGRNGYTGCPGQQGGSAASGQTAGQGGDAQAGGGGGSGGTVTVQYRTLTSGAIANLQMQADGGKAGQAGAVGQGGAPNGAVGGSPPGAAAGMNGSASVSTFTDAAVLGQAFDEIYLLKAVETAKLQYMLNEPEAFSSDPPPISPDSPYGAVRTMLEWLQAVLSGYASLSGFTNPTDSDHRKNNLYLIASTYCARIAQSPLLTSAGDLASSIPGWALQSWDSTVDIQTWIEEKYLGASNGTDILTNLQASYTAYMTAFANIMKAEDKAEAIQQQYQTYENAATSYKTTCDALLAMLDPSQSSSIGGQLSLAKQNLLDSFTTLAPILQQVKDTINNHYDCNVNNVVSTLSSAVPQMLFMAASPELMAPMAAASMTPLIMDGLTQITDNSGKALDKSQVMTDLNVVQEGDFIGYVKGNLLNADGTLKSSTTYVLSQLDTLVNDVSSLSQSIDNDHKKDNPELAEQAVAALEALKQAIITKSQLQLQYQCYAAAAATAWKNYQDAQAHAEAINAQKPIMTPDLLGHVSFLAMQYQQGLTDYIAFESQFKRYVVWLTLNTSPDDTGDSNLTQTATQLSSYWSQGTPPSADDVNVVTNSLQAYKTALGNYYTTQSSANVASPHDSKGNLNISQRPDTLIISITADSILEKIRQGVPQSESTFLTGIPVTFMIVPFGIAKQWGVRRGDTTYPPYTNKDGTITYFYVNSALGLSGIPMVEYSQSGNYYDLRADYVQPRIIGAKYTGTTYTGTTLPLSKNAPAQSIAVNIHASATRWFWGATASRQRLTDHLIFTHPNSRDATFVHYYPTKPHTLSTAYDVSGDAGELDDGSSTPLGIYGLWTISLASWTKDSDPNAQIDFSTVTEIELGFCGTYKVIGSSAGRR
jgi:hypothetical protein